MQLDEQARLVAERGMVLIGNEEEDEDAAAFDAKTSEEEQEKRTRAIVSAETATILSGIIFDLDFGSPMRAKKFFQLENLNIFL